MIAEAIIGHLVGDYILQNDWQAKHKTTPMPGELDIVARAMMHDRLVGTCRGYDEATRERLKAYEDGMGRWWKGNVACGLHALLWTLSVWACTGFGFGLLCAAWLFVTHYVIDRNGLAAWWMRNVSGQAVFADKMGPWSIIAVDNTIHLLTILVGVKLLG